MGNVQGFGGWPRRLVKAQQQQQQQRDGARVDGYGGEAALAGPYHAGEPQHQEIGAASTQDPSILRFQSWFLIAQNFIGALLSVPVLVTGFLIAQSNHHDGEQCAAFMHTPIIAIGALLLLVSLAGLVAAVFDKWVSRAAFLAWLHLLLMFSLVILLFCFSIFSLEVTNQNLAHSVTGYGQTYKEYRLYEYPKWMRHRVEHKSYWIGVKSCLQSSFICNSGYIPDFSSNITYTSIEDLTPIQRGCCIPPSACNISFTGAEEEPHQVTTTNKKIHNLENHTNGSLNFTMDEIEEKFLSTTIHAYIHDCSRWNSNPYQLCYDCDTCKAGIIQANMDKWKYAGILYVILVMIMVFMYALFACYGFVQDKDI